jgi:cyclase
MNDGGTPGLTRRDLLRTGALTAASALIAPAIPAWAGPFAAHLRQAPADPVAKMRADLAANPIERQKLSESLTMLSGPGGNVVVLHGSDGKIVVDGFVQPAWGSLKNALDGMGNAKIEALVDTHWHLDHADNNANFRKAGAAIVAHENTRKRLSEAHDLLGMRFPPQPPDALPTRTFTSKHAMSANGEQVALGHIPPAHTDTDVWIHFANGNVLHLGDVFFNGTYPFIDAGTGGSINGMIAGVEMMLKMVDASTRIVPGHGPLGDRAALTGFRDMMATVRDSVQKLKQAGRTVDEVAANVTKDFDPVWGKGFMPPNLFVSIVYNTLP